MAIGTSLGAYFPDEISFHMNSFIDQGDGVSSPAPSVKKDNNEVSPDSVTDTKELRDPNKPVTVSDQVPDRNVHFNDAVKDMNLNQQEQDLYQRHLNNLYGPGGVDNDGSNPNLPAGSRSTLYQSPAEHEGKFYNIPTVWDGKIETEPYKRDDGSMVDVPNQTALDNVGKVGWDKFPSYPTSEEADNRYMKMHDYMDKDTGDYIASQMK